MKAKEKQKEDNKNNTLEYCDKLEVFFSKSTIPDIVRLDQATIIMDTRKFINTNLTIVRTNPTSKSYAPYLKRLLTLKDIVKSKNYLPIGEIAPQKQNNPTEAIKEPKTEQKKAEKNPMQRKQTTKTTKKNTSTLF